jgi:DNA polymerase-3 subunit alpha
VHACGILITPDPVTTYTSIQPIDKKHQDPESTNLSMAVTQNDGKMLEDVGLLKMDFLGLRNLSIIKNCIKIIRARHQKE